MATSLHDIPGEHIACIPFREHAAATASEWGYCYQLPFKAKITSVAVIFNADITGADTNYTRFAVGYDDGGLEPFKSTDFTSGTNATEGASNDYSPSVETILAAGTNIAITWTKVASGLKIPTGLLIIKYVGA